MADEKTTKAFKVLTDFRDHINSVIEQSEYPSDEKWLVAVTSMYEMQQLKDGMPGHRKQLDELEYHAARLRELYTEMVRTEDARRLELNQQHEAAVSRLTLENADLQEAIEGYKERLKMTHGELDELSEDNGKLQTVIEQLQQLNERSNELVSEYKEKNDTLTGLVKEYKPAADRVSELEGLLAAAELQNERHLLVIDGLQQERERLQAAAKERDTAHRRQFEEMQKAHGRDLGQLKKQHEADNQAFAERQENEKQRAILEIRREYQDKHEHTQNESNTKIRQLLDEIRALQNLHHEQTPKETKPDATNDV